MSVGTQQPVEQPWRRRVSWALRLMIIALVLLVAGIVTVIIGVKQLADGYRGVVVTGASMEKTFQPGQRLLLRDGDTDVRRGDIVALRDDVWPGAQGQTLVKRVVGIGGDTVSSTGGGHLTVDGHQINEPYAGQGALPPFSVKVPAGSVFVLGDNRGNSRDSSTYTRGANDGAVPLSAIQGIAIADGTGSALPTTTAFVDAGLPGAPTDDSGVWPDILTTAIGVLLMGLALLTLFGGLVVWFIARRNRTARS